MSGHNESQLISDASRQRIDAWLSKYPPDRKASAVIAALTIVQEQNGGWLTPDLMDAVAGYLDMPRVSVYEVGSFYSMFALQPVGRHKVSVCRNISCMLSGADDLLAHIEMKYGVRPGDTTKDGRFTLVKEEECLAACCGGPMMVVDGHYHENLTAEKLTEILDKLD